MHPILIIAAFAALSAVIACVLYHAFRGVLGIERRGRRREGADDRAAALPMTGGPHEARGSTGGSEVPTLPD